MAFFHPVMDFISSMQWWASYFLKVTSYKLQLLGKKSYSYLAKKLPKLYYVMVHPYLIYGLGAWGSTFPSYIEKLNILQNKAVKLIGGGNYLDRATPYHSKLNILKLPDLYKLEIAKFVH